MCGYCVEGINLGLLQQALTASSLTPGTGTPCFDALAYLQEWPDFAAALARADAECLDFPATACVVACRGLATLLEQGYDSAAYQGLLAQPAYPLALDYYLASLREKGLPASDPRFDLSVAEWVFDREVYLHPGRFAECIRGWTQREARFLLDQYVEVFLSAEMDPDERMQAEDNQVIINPLPAFWLAMHWLARFGEEIAPVWEVARKPHPGVPGFPGMRLWMQRRAALLVHDRLKLAPFLGELPCIRPELLQYLGLMRPPTGEEMAALRQALDALPAGDHQGDRFSLRRWLEEGDLQLE